VKLPRWQQTAAPGSALAFRGPPASFKEDGKLQGTGTSQERKEDTRKADAQSTGKNKNHGREEEL